jgi:hypothetical protein
MRNGDGSASQRCPSRTMARNSYWAADLGRIFARSDEPGMICKQLMRRRSRPHDYRTVLWDDRILLWGASLATRPPSRGCGLSRALRDDVGSECWGGDGDRAWSDRSTGNGVLHNARASGYGVGSESRSLGSLLPVAPSSRPRDQQQAAQSLAPLSASWSTEFPRALQRARPQAKTAAEWRLEGR